MTERRLRIMLDPGHGGNDSGASFKGDRESHVALLVSLATYHVLATLGYEVFQTRTTDVFIPLGERAAIANRQQVDAFVSIHCNSAQNDQAQGVETYHFPGSVRGEILAREAHRALLGHVPGHVDRGVKTAGFAVLRLTHAPAILVELEFLSHRDRRRELLDPCHQERLGSALAAGIDAGVRSFEVPT